MTVLDGLEKKPLKKKYRAARSLLSTIPNVVVIPPLRWGLPSAPVEKVVSTDDLCGLGFLQIPYGQEEIRALVRPSIDRVHLRRVVVVKLSRRSIIEVGMLAL